MSESGEVRIREATLSDRDSVADLWLRLMNESAAADPRFTVADDAVKRWHNDFPEWLHGGAGFRVNIAEADGRVVAFVTAQQWFPAPVHQPESEVFINDLYCLPEYRKRGIGTQLVQSIREWAPSVGARRLRFGVLAVNTAGLEFWEKLGAKGYSLYLTLDVPFPQNKRS